jgi:hypothetical protein
MLRAPRARQLALRAAALLLAATVAACRQPDGSRLYPVLGIGLIAVRDKHSADLHATHTRAAGLLASPAPPLRGVLLGTLDTTTLAVPTSASVTIDAARAANRWHITTQAHP